MPDRIVTGPYVDNRNRGKSRPYAVNVREGAHILVVRFTDRDRAARFARRDAHRMPWPELARLATIGG